MRPSRCSGVDGSAGWYGPSSWYGNSGSFFPAKQCRCVSTTGDFTSAANSNGVNPRAESVVRTERLVSIEHLAERDGHAQHRTRSQGRAQTRLRQSRNGFFAEVSGRTGVRIEAASVLGVRDRIFLPRSRRSPQHLSRRNDQPSFTIEHASNCRAARPCEGPRRTHCPWTKSSMHFVLTGLA